MTATSMLECALDALAHGLAVVPPAEDGSKRPSGKWQQYQQRLPTEAEIRKWYAKDRTGIGLVTGAVSGNLEMLEFEGRAVDDNQLQVFQDLADAAGLSDVVARIFQGYSEWTPTGGVHLLYRVTGGEVASNTKLARRPGAEPHTIDVLVETRGEGGYVIVAPSHGKVHPSGSEWTLIHGGFGSIAEITADERDELHRVARALDCMPAPPPAKQAPKYEGGNGARPGDDYNADPHAGDRVLELLQRHGWAEVFRRGHDVHLRRPGKEIGTSAVLHLDGGVFMCFTTSTEFEAEDAYSPFGVLAVLEHGGDFQSAARALKAAAAPPKERTNGHAPSSWLQPTVPTEEPPPPPLDEPSAAEEQPASAVDILRGEILHGAQIKGIPARRSLVKGMLDLNSLSLLFGRSAGGKTFVAIDIALHIATHSWWHGRKVRGGDVLYIVAEGVSGVADRQIAWEKQNNRYTPVENIHWLPRAVNLLDPVAATALAHVSAELNPKLVVIDTLARSMVGGDENTGKDMSRVIDAADRIKARTGACVLVVHHSGKDQSAGSRGWSGLLGAVDTELELKNAGDNVLTLSTTKQKDGPNELPMRFTLVPHRWTCPDCQGSGKVDDEECDRCDGDTTVGSVAVARYTGQLAADAGLSPKTQSTLDALLAIDTGTGATKEQWRIVAEEAGIPKATFYRHIKVLIDKGLVAQEGSEVRPRYIALFREEAA